MAVHTLSWKLDGKDIWEASSNCKRACKKSPPKHFPDHPYNINLIKKGRCHLPLQASSRKEIVAISLFTGRIYCIEFNIVNLKTISQKFTYARLFLEGYFWWRNIFSTSIYWYNTFEVVRISRIKDLPAHKILNAKHYRPLGRNCLIFF